MPWRRSSGSELSHDRRRCASDAVATQSGPVRCAHPCDASSPWDDAAMVHYKKKVH